MVTKKGLKVTKRHVLVSLWVVILTSLALVMASTGTPSTQQHLEWQVRQHLKADGVEVGLVGCVQDEDDGTIGGDFLRTGNYWSCTLDIDGVEDPTIRIFWWGSGVWSIVDPADIP